MSHFVNQRKAISASLITAAITVHGLVIENLDFIASTAHWSGLVRFLLSGGFVYSTIVIFPLYIYDELFWKFINPKYDLEGRWRVRVTNLKSLNGLHVTNKGIQECERLANEIISTSIECSIQQNPFRIWVEEATGGSISNSNKIVSYSAEIIGVNLPGEIYVVFEAAVDGSLSGRDILTVSDRDWRKRPLVLVGNAFHVFAGFDIVIKGDIVYERLGKKGVLSKKNKFETLPISASEVRPRTKL